MENQYPDKGPGTSVRVEGGWFIGSGVIDVGRTATLLAQRNDARYGLCLVNDGPETVYIGSRNSATVSQGFALHVGSMLSLGTHAELYGVSAGGTGIVRYIEEVR